MAQNVLFGNFILNTREVKPQQFSFSQAFPVLWPTSLARVCSAALTFHVKTLHSRSFSSGAETWGPDDEIRLQSVQKINSGSKGLDTRIRDLSIPGLHYLQKLLANDSSREIWAEEAARSLRLPFAFLPHWSSDAFTVRFSWLIGSGTGVHGLWTDTFPHFLKPAPPLSTLFLSCKNLPCPVYL